MTERNVPGRWLVLPIAAAVLVAAVVVVGYKVQGAPEQRIDFQRVAGNATVAPLDPAKVHADRFLERHLDLAAQRGASSDDVALRVEGMARTLESITGSPGPEWVVGWKGETVRVSWAR